MRIAAVLACLVLVGCSSPGVAPSASPSLHASSGAATTGGAGTQRLTPGEIEQRRADDLRGLAQALRLSDPPVVAVVRPVGPDTVLQGRGQCMRAAGFDATDDGRARGSAGQTEAFNLALYTCAAQYPIGDKYLQPYDTAQLTIIYDYYRDVSIPCLKGLGLMPAELPSLQTFLDTLNTPAEYQPTNGLSLTPESARDTESQCRSLPPESVLWSGR